MQAFMLYMSGGGVQVFSMGIVFMLLSSPFKNLAAMNAGEPTTTPCHPQIADIYFLSLCTFRSIIQLKQVGSRCGIIHNSPFAKIGVSHMQSAHTRARALEVPVDGFVTNRDGRLAGI